MKLFSIVKTITDFTIAIIAIVVSLPIILIYSFWVMIIYKTNPIIKQRRGISLSNGLITIYKLRTIKPESKVYYKDEKSLSKITTEENILPGGSFFRKTGFDETPQLLNVLSGKMSLIGPRPLVLDDLLRMEKVNKEYIKSRDMIKSKTGISGLWQLKRSEEFNFEELISFDAKYESGKSVMLDFKLLFMTLKRITARKHIDGIIR